MFGLGPVELILLAVFAGIFYFLLVRLARRKNQSGSPRQSNSKDTTASGSSQSVDIGDGKEGEPTPASNSTQIFEQETKRCPECGAEVPASKESCPNCGHAF